MIKNRILSAILAGTLFVGVLPQFSLAGIANAEPSGRVEWTGYDMSTVNFSTWDGVTYDTSWYTGEGGRQVHAGTEDDPYLIEDADDLAGLHILTNSSANNGDLKVDIDPSTYSCQDATRSNLYPFKAKSVTFFDKSKDPTDLLAYYTYSSNSEIVDSYLTQSSNEAVLRAHIIGTIEQQAEERLYQGVASRPYYINVTGLKLTRGTEEVILTGEQMISDLKANVNSNFARMLRPAVNGERGYEIGDLEYYLGYSYEYVSGYAINNLKLDNATNRLQLADASCDATNMLYASDFLGITLKNIKDDSITITDANFMDFELYDLNVSSACAPVISNHVDKLFNPTEIDSVYRNNYQSGSTYYFKNTIYMPGRRGNAAKQIWEDTENESTNFLDRLVYLDTDKYSKSLSVEFTLNSSKYLKYKYSTPLTSMSYYQSWGTATFESDFNLYDIEDSILDIDWDFDNQKLYVTFLGVVLSSGEEVLCTNASKPKITLTTNSTFYFSENDFTKMCHSNTYSSYGDDWEDIVYNPTRFRLVATNIGMSEYKSWYIRNQHRVANETIWDSITATDPTFAGKYFKLMCDIEDAPACSPVPYVEGYGFAGNFDLNNHVLKGSHFGAVLDTGRVHNGIVVANIGQTFISTLFGIVDSIVFMPESLFDRSVVETKISATTLVNVNLGEIHNIDTKLTTSSRIQITSYSSGSNGLVEDVNIQLVHPTNDLATAGQTFPLLFTIYGSTVRNVTIDADRDLVGTETQTYKLTSQNIVCHNAYNIEVKDFTVYTDLSECTPLPVTGNIYNSSSKLSAKVNSATCAYSGGGTNTLSGSGNLINCKIDYKLDVEGNITSCGYKYGALNSIIDSCDISIEYRSRNSADNPVIKTNCIKNSTITFKCLDSPIGYISPVIGIEGNGILQNTNITAIGATEQIPSGVYNTYYGSVVRGARTIDNCNFYVRNYAGTGAIINSTNNSTVSNCTIDAELVYKNYEPIINADIIENTKVSGKYLNVTNERTDDTHYLNTCNNQYVNSEVHILFDQSCNNKDKKILGNDYQFAGGLHISSIKDCVVSVTSESDDVIIRTPFRGGANYYATPFFENSIVYMDNIIIDGSDSDYRPSVIFLNRPLAQPITNLYIYGKNIGVTSRIKPFSVIDYGNTGSSTLSKCYSNIQFRDDYKNIPIAFANLSNFNGALMALTDIVLESNTEDGSSCLARVGPNMVNDIKNGYRSLLAKNIYLNLENAQNNLTPSSTADGMIPGLFAKKYWNNSYDIDNYYLNDLGYSMYLNDMIGTSNIIVPTGHSTVLQYYNPDDVTLDSWNSNKEYVNSWANTQILPEEEQGQFADMQPDKAVSYIDMPAAAALSGELAYRLDSGSSQYRRSRNWTVLEEDVAVINSVTNQNVGVLPAGLFLADLKVNSAAVRDLSDTNLSPIYKLAVNPVENGSVTTQGLAGKSSADGDVYVKQNTVLGVDEQVNDDRYMLAYATQSFYGSTPSKIPSTAGGITRFGLRNTEPTYTIDGYKVNAADTVITPVFKVARYITVNIDGAENATIIPSALVSASGETITLTPNYNNGYIVTDLKVNGDPLTKSSFVMPDEDVEITGKAVTFDGGITKYSVFGFNGVIDQIAHTIDVTVPRMGNISNALADIEYVGDYITPSVDMHVDLTNPVTYTVTYNTDKTIDYLVTVTQSDYAMRITDFAINGRHATINQATRTITLEMPYGTDLSNLTPDISYSAESITPASNQALDFRVPQVYTLYAAGMDNVSYTVTVTNEGDSIAEITEYVYSGYTGEIDNDNNTITLNIPSLLNTASMIPSVLNYSGRLLTPSKAAGITVSDSDPEYTVESQNGFRRSYNMVLNLLSDSDAEITRFTLGGYEGVIDNNLNTITLKVPRTLNLVDVIPDTVTYTGKSIYPRVDIPQDFTNNPVYTVVAMDNSEKAYTVNIEYLNDSALITYFELYGFAGEIDQTNKTISVNVPYGFDLTDTAPTAIEYSSNATLTPLSSVSRDFSQPQTYTVTSQDGLTTNTYTVTCTVAEAYDNRITRFVLDGVEGVINDIGADLGTIDITITEKIPNVNYSSIIPDVIRVSTGATVNPVANTARNFANTDPTYTVTGVYSGDRTYTVHLTVVPLNKTAKITEFVVGGIPGAIDEENGIIDVILPSDTTVDITNVDPDITWQGNAINPDEDDLQDFTNPVVYTVTAEDPRVTKAYTVTITVDHNLNSGCMITKYVVGDFSGSINQTSGIIKFNIPKSREAEYNTDLVPASIVWSGDTLTPDDTTAVNIFSSPQYTVSTSTDSKVYTVQVAVFDDTPAPTPTPNPGTDPNPNPNPGTDPGPVLSDRCSIDYYKALGISGVIDQNSLTITMSIPEKLKDATSNVVPDAVVWTGTKLTPTERQAVTLADGLQYTVTAESGKTKVYTIKIDWLPGEPEAVPSKDCFITEYHANGTKAIIDQEALTIAFKVSESDKDKWTNVVPDNIVWIGSKLTPAEADTVNLAGGTVYRVYAEDQAMFKDYSVMIDWIPADVPGENPDTGYTAIWDIGRIVFLILVTGGTVIFIHRKKRDY